MSLSDRRKLLLTLGALALAGACGFAPAYAPGGVADGLTGAVELAAPRDQNAYVFVRQMERRLGQPDAARFMLDYTLATERLAVGVTQAQETTRYHISGTASFTLTDRATGAVVQTGEVSSFSAYAATGSTVATLRATRDAYDRLMVMLADQLVTRLGATAADWLP